LPTVRENPVNPLNDPARRAALYLKARRSGTRPEFLWRSYAGASRAGWHSYSSMIFYEMKEHSALPDVSAPFHLAVVKAR
jgi:hypothetical protein